MFTLIDSAGLLAAVALYVPILLLPGYAIGASFNALGFRDADGTTKIGLAALLALAILPGPLAFLTSLIGLWAAAVALVVGAICGGAALAMDGLPRPSKRAVTIAAMWLVLVLVLWIDIQVGDRLYQSLLMLDMLKHAAITRGIVESGMTPPADPFFLRDGAAVFYYFYFIVAAVLDWLAGALIDARAAVGGLVVWTGVALVTLPRLLYRRAGLRGPERIWPLLLLLATVSGIQVVIAVLFGGAQSGWGNPQVTPWPLAVLWVPHHVAALLASWVALLLLVDCDVQRGGAGRRYHIALAACALASSAGLSVWVTVGTVVALAAWSIMLVRARRWPMLAAVMAAGVGSVLIAAPFLWQLLAGQSGDGAAPVAIMVREFILAEVVATALGLGSLGSALLNLAALPLNYFYEAPLLVVGSWLFWTKPALRRGVGGDVAVLLVVTTTSALVIGSFVQSTIGNNDLGWRVMMFAQVGALLWTAHVLFATVRHVPGGGPTAILSRLPRTIVVLFAAGLVTLSYDLVMLRAAVTLPFANIDNEQKHPIVARELRAAYGWLNANLAAERVTQHNPARGRAFGFALYGRHRVGVSDRHNAYLLGASRRDAAERVATVSAVFAAPLEASEVAAIARRVGVDVLVVTAVDPVWAKQPAWLTGPAVMYATANVRLVRVDRLAEQIKP